MSAEVMLPEWAYSFPAWVCPGARAVNREAIAVGPSLVAPPGVVFEVLALGGRPFPTRVKLATVNQAQRCEVEFGPTHFEDLFRPGGVPDERLDGWREVLS